MTISESAMDWAVPAHVNSWSGALGDQGRYIGNTTDVIDSHERVGGR
jgi:hypothetical protein